jgi:hypothetical protein
MFSRDRVHAHAANRICLQCYSFSLRNFGGHRVFIAAPCSVLFDGNALY